MFTSLSHSLSHYSALSHQRPGSSKLIFTDVPSFELLNKFTLALNANGHLHYKVYVEKLMQVPYIQIVHTEWGDVVGGSTIKYRDADVAEIGYMLVDKEYRGQGIAEYMTHSRIEHARKAGIKILFAKIRGNNVNSISNLRKAGFQPAVNTFHQMHNGSPVSWYYLPLVSIPQDQCRKWLRKNIIGSVPVVN